MLVKGAPDACLVALFWVQSDQKDMVGPTAGTVDLGDNSVARASVGGKLIGGRVFTKFLTPIFLGALDGVEYTKTSGVFEVLQTTFSE